MGDMADMINEGGELEDAFDGGRILREETEMNHEQEPLYAYCCWTQIDSGLFETDCGHRDETEPNPDWVCCPYCGELIKDAHKDNDMEANKKSRFVKIKAARGFGDDIFYVRSYNSRSDEFTLQRLSKDDGDATG